MCPQSWKDNGRRCPEPDQPNVMPGPWPFTGLETINPGADLGIQARRSSSGALLERSGRMYSCDEFPPASWVEGGVGMRDGMLNTFAKLGHLVTHVFSRCPDS